ncbi:MAG: serine/threonine-protein kinase [Slackia sp.]|nr:serine/threonine-protein kinase [Slackia sp.]
MQNLILNRYRPLDVAGKGGYGTVQVAWDMRIQRRVAIKCLQLDTLSFAGAPRDIPGLEEARTAAMLSDPHIVGVYDFEVEGSMAYLIMEYMDGITLTELMRMAGGPLPLDVLTCVFESVAHAIEVAHENQVLHLDIKPDNVLINRQGRVKVADFGLAQLSHEAGFGKAAGGTIGYMPLEQMRLEALDVRTDEWALAALTYQMLTGDNPFFAYDLAGAQRAIEEAEIVIPSLARGDVSEEVDEAVFGALAIDRADRFESVTLFAEAMTPHLGDARRGEKQLAVIVGDACADEEEEEPVDGTDEMPAVARVRFGIAEKLRGGIGEAIGGVWSAVACGAAAYTGLSHVDIAALFGGSGSAGTWAMAIAVAVVGAAFPRVGAVLALAALASGMVANGAFLAAAAFVAAGAAWFVSCGRFGKAQAMAGSSVAGLSLVGGLGVLPLVAGFCLWPRDALVTVLFAIASAFVLTYCGMGSFTGGGLFVPGSLAGGAETGVIAQLFDPSVWVIAASWLAAAAAASLFCSRGGRVFSCVGMAAATGVLVFGLMARAFIESGFSAWLPDAADVAVVSVAGAAATVLAGWLGAPERRGRAGRRRHAAHGMEESAVHDGYDAYHGSESMPASSSFGGDSRGW